MARHNSKLIMRALLLLCAFGCSNLALAACKIPEPPMIPNGMTTDRDTIISATVNVKAFMAENEDYRNCLKKQLTALGEASTDTDKAAWGKLHDASVDIEEQTAASFNAQIRIFKSR